MRIGIFLAYWPWFSPSEQVELATLDVLSDGRFRLGLGVSGPQVSEGWYGVPFRRPLARTREYVEIVRKVLAREAPLEHSGREWTLPLGEEQGGSGLGKPLKLLARPVQERILDDRLAAYDAAGVNTVVAIPGGDRAATVRLLAEATARETVG